MSFVNIPAYEGSSPFIYVYYAEDDTRLALPVLARLYNEGLRMWSWNGCAQPTDVRATQRISSCAALIIFLSENLDRDIQRGNFEAMEALKCNKVKYFVRLSDMDLPFDWGKSDANVVIDYVRSNEAAFWLSIYDSDIIESCRGAWPKNPVKVGLSVFDSIDSEELSDEYSNILKIIGKAPALDRSGAPINADDIAIFAGAGETEEPEKEPEKEIEIPVEDLNSKSMQDLFGMLDEISISTRKKAEELQQSAEKRREEQEKAAMQRASLPFEHDAVKTVHSDEPPVPALSFAPAAMSVEALAAEMFGVSFDDTEYETVEFAPVEEPELPEVVIIEDIAEKEEATEEPSFEAFIDDLAGFGISEEPTADTEPEIAEEISEENVQEENAFVPMPTAPKTVEITEDSEHSLLPPASGSLTGFELPDDDYISTVYVYNDDENVPVITADERAAAAEKSRKQFESALENAAFKVTGRIVARHSKGKDSVGLRVRKPKTVKLSVHAKVKTAKTVIAKPAEPSKSEKNERGLSRAQRRERRRRKETEVPAVQSAEESAERKVTVIPAPMRGEKPADTVTAPAKESEQAQSSAPVQNNPEGAEATVSARKKRHPHNSSGLLGILRELKSQKNDEVSTEETGSDN